jgi:hypothetical protein
MVVLVIASLGTLVEPKDTSAANGGTDGLAATPGQWQATGSMCLFRVLQTATLLSTGEVLVTGGFNQGAPPPYCDATANPAELYNPARGQWGTSGAETSIRYYHTATLLPSGQVLVAGGIGLNETALNSAELYDPGSRRWLETRALGTARSFHTATLLPSGQVLVSGGCAGGNAIASSEIYDPGSASWTRTGALNIARCQHTATLLPSGQVLVAGGSADGSATAEVYDPDTGQWSLTAGTMVQLRIQHTATLLPSGQVLVAAGSAAQPGGPPTAELYDPPPVAGLRPGC